MYNSQHTVHVTAEFADVSQLDVKDEDTKTSLLW